jgi:hypothetical protein
MAIVQILSLSENYYLYAVWHMRTYVYTVHMVKTGDQRDDVDRS